MFRFVRTSATAAFQQHQQQQYRRHDILGRSFMTRMMSTAATAQHQQLVPPKLPLRFLRDSDEQNFHPVTQQRTDVVYDGETGKPSQKHPFSQQQRYQVKNMRLDDEENHVIEWADGRSSEYSRHWIGDKLANWQKAQVSPKLWTGLSESDVRESSDLSMAFDALLLPDNQGQHRALKALYKYGILLVTDTPLDDGGAAIAAIASSVSGSCKKHLGSTSLIEHYRQGGTNIVLPHGTDGPMRTLYGNVWFTSSSVQAEGTSVADSAYGLDGLPLHTDMTYMLLPPGLQIFTMIKPADKGGESIYADGFAAAEILRSEDPKAFQLLTTICRTYHCVDKETGWHLQGSGPVIEMRNGVVVRIRHNDLDRLPDLPPYGTKESDYEVFYSELADAHAKWDEILARDSTRLIMKLNPGDTVIVANQRCMHGRYSFELGSTPRAVSGCYVGQDELNSRFRMEGYQVVV